MSGSGWLHRLAVGGTLTGLLCLVSVHADSQSADGDSQAAATNQSTPHSFADAATIGNATETKITTGEGYQGSEYWREEREWADLRAQEAMAAASEWLAELTKWQAIIGSVGLVGLGWTLWYTRKTANAAIAAASAADLSARAEVAYKLPFLRIGEPELTILDNEPTTPAPWSGLVNRGPLTTVSHIHDLVFRNDGMSTAVILDVRVGIFLGNSLPGIPDYRWTIPVDFGEVILSNRQARLPTPIWFVLSDAEKTAANSGDSPLWLYINVRHIDFMDNRRENGFVWQWAPHGPGGSFRFAVPAEPPQAYVTKT